MNRQNYVNSPRWSDSSKRTVWLILIGGALLLLYRLRYLLLPLIMAVVLAYLVTPAVKGLQSRFRLPKSVALALVYLLIVAALIAIPASAIPPIANQINNLLNNTPRYIQQVGDFLQKPLVINESIEIPIDELALGPTYTALTTNLLDIIQTVGRQTLAVFSTVASATLSTVGWTIVVLFLSFYLVKDHETLFAGIMQLTPPDYRDEMLRMSEEINKTWHAFLRGQLVLCLVVGMIVFGVALVLGLPNAILLALIAGLAEFLPTIGPVLAAIPAAFLAFFQSESSWIGQAMSPFWFTVLVLGLYAVIFQMENYYLVPRIIGYHLKLHPLVVILGALAGASVAGLLGILLAAPVLATGRLVLLYVYCKLTDQPPFPDMVTALDEVETAVSLRPFSSAEPPASHQTKSVLEKEQT
ncbi:MAG: AI-2E family transporter [Chloroflexi bacterium]|nr:MAG: AI-2E family transporter [Chloroflexota bacterium]